VLLPTYFQVFVLEKQFVHLTYLVLLQFVYLISFERLPIA